MPTENKCPFCGADYRWQNDFGGDVFKCWTYADSRGNFIQHQHCKDRQLAALKALVREMRAYVFLFYMTTENPILEMRAKNLLNRPEVKAIMEGK